jgi:DegV family protein with EDD domain
MSSRCRVYFMVDTLKYLAMGGRIGGAAALLGSVLQIKPVLTLREGAIDTYEKVRTHRRAVDRLKQLVVEQIAPGDTGHLSVMHAAAEDQAQALVGYFCDELGLTSIDVLAVPPAIVTHAGPGALAVGFFTE